MSNPPKAKKLKLSVKGAKSTAELTSNCAEKEKPGNLVNGDNGKCKFEGNKTDSESSENMDDLEDTSLDSDSDLSDSSDSSLESGLSEDESSDYESASTAGTDEESTTNGNDSSKESEKASDKKWTTMHKEDLQGMLNETAGFQNHYEIMKHFWSRQGEL